MITDLATGYKYIESFIPRQTQPPKGNYSLENIKYLAHLAGDPQNSINIIHMAATSGKGSTCYAVSAILVEHGLKVGLSVSPHIVDVRERFMINNDLISEDKFAEHIQNFSQFAEQSIRVGKKPSYYEFLMVFAYYVFAQEGVGIAVIETGCGGLLDGSNITDHPNKVCILGQIGLDHIEILGDTLEKIAYQKAGIVHSGNSVVYLEQSAEITEVFQKEINNKTDVDSISLSEDQITLTKADIYGIDFELLHNGKATTWSTAVTGDYQSSNISLAYLAAMQASKRGWFQLDEAKAQSAVKKLRLPGRLELINTDGKEIILDGAHNLQKVEALVTSLQKYTPSQKYCLLIALKKGKNNQAEMVQKLASIADQVIITSFFQNQDYSSMSRDPLEIAEILNDHSNVVVEADIHKALNLALQQQAPVLITGSIYLLAEVYPLLK